MAHEERQAIAAAIAAIQNKATVDTTGRLTAAQAADVVADQAELAGSLSLADTMRGFGDAASIPASPNYRLFAPGDEGTGFAMSQAGFAYGSAAAGNDVMWGVAGYMSSKATAAATDGSIAFGKYTSNWNMADGHSFIFAGTFKDSTGSNPGTAIRIAGNSGSTTQAGWALQMTTAGALQMMFNDATNARASLATAVVRDGADHTFVMLVDGRTKQARIWIDKVRGVNSTTDTLVTVTGSTRLAIRDLSLGNAGNSAAVATRAISWKNVHFLTMAGGLPMNWLEIAAYLMKNIDEPLPMWLLNETLAPEFTVPATTTVTQATKDLYGRLGRYTGAREFMLGVHDRHHSGAKSPAKQGLEAAFVQMTGKHPAFMQWEYVDSTEAAATSTDPYEGLPQVAARASGHAQLIDDIKDCHRRGIWSMVHDHAGSPLSLGMSSSMASLDYETTTGSPLAAIKTGGAQEAQFLAWMDRLATFFAALVDDDGALIPVVFRPFHEMNGVTFWWRATTDGSTLDATRQADMVLVWQQMYTYLVTTKAVTNVLFAWNVSMGISTSAFQHSGVNPYSAWYPGDAYVDIVSADIYFNAAFTSASSWSMAGTAPRVDAAALLTIASTTRKPMLLAELGANGSAVTAHATVDHLWDQWGDDIASLHRCFAAVGQWRPNSGPRPSDLAAAGVARLANRRYCITAE